MNDRRVGFGPPFDEHVADEFVLRSVDVTMGTMTDDPLVLHLRTLLDPQGLPVCGGEAADAPESGWSGNALLGRVASPAGAPVG